MAMSADEILFNIRLAVENGDAKRLEDTLKALDRDFRELAKTGDAAFGAKLNAQIDQVTTKVKQLQWAMAELAKQENIVAGRASKGKVSGIGKLTELQGIAQVAGGEFSAALSDLERISVDARKKQQSQLAALRQARQRTEAVAKESGLQADTVVRIRNLIGTRVKDATLAESLTRTVVQKSITNTDLLLSSRMILAQKLRDSFAGETYAGEVTKAGGGGLLALKMANMARAEAAVLKKAEATPVLTRLQRTIERRVKDATAAAQLAGAANEKLLLQGASDIFAQKQKALHAAIATGEAQIYRATLAKFNEQARMRAVMRQALGTTAGVIPSSSTDALILQQKRQGVYDPKMAELYIKDKEFFNQFFSRSRRAATYAGAYATQLERFGGIANYGNMFGFGTVMPVEEIRRSLTSLSNLQAFLNTIPQAFGPKGSIGRITSLIDQMNVVKRLPNEPRTFEYKMFFDPKYKDQMEKMIDYVRGGGTREGIAAAFGYKDTSKTLIKRMSGVFDTVSELRTFPLEFLSKYSQNINENARGLMAAYMAALPVRGRWNTMMQRYVLGDYAQRINPEGGMGQIITGYALDRKTREYKPQFFGGTELEWQIARRIMPEQNMFQRMRDNYREFYKEFQYGPKTIEGSWNNVVKTFGLLQAALPQIGRAMNETWTRMTFAFSRVAYGIRTISFELGMFKIMFLGTFGAAVSKVKEFGQAIIDVTQQQREAKVLLEGVFGDPKLVKEMVQFAREYAVQTPATFKDITYMVKSFGMIPDVKNMILGAKDDKARKELYKQLAYVSIGLGATKPEQGMEGAIFAIREALAGQFRSLKMRFEIPTSALAMMYGTTESELKKDPKMMLDALQQFLQINIGEETLKKVAQTYRIQIQNIYDFIEAIQVRIGEAWVGADTLYDHITARAASIGLAFQSLTTTGSLGTPLTGAQRELQMRFSPFVTEMAKGVSRFFDSFYDATENLLGRVVMPRDETSLRKLMPYATKAREVAKEKVAAGELPNTVEAINAFIRRSILIPATMQKMVKMIDLLNYAMTRLTTSFGNLLEDILSNEGKFKTIVDSFVDVTNVVLRVLSGFVTFILGAVNVIQKLPVPEWMKTAMMFAAVFPVASTNIIMNTIRLMFFEPLNLLTSPAFRNALSLSFTTLSRLTIALGQFAKSLLLLEGTSAVAAHLRGAGGLVGGAVSLLSPQKGFTSKADVDAYVAQMAARNLGGGAQGPMLTSAVTGKNYPAAIITGAADYIRKGWDWLVKSVMSTALVTGIVAMWAKINGGITGLFTKAGSSTIYTGIRGFIVEAVFFIAQSFGYTIKTLFLSKAAAIVAAIFGGGALLEKIFGVKGGFFTESLKVAIGAVAVAFGALKGPVEKVGSVFVWLGEKLYEFGSIVINLVGKLAALIVSLPGMAADKLKLGAEWVKDIMFAGGSNWKAIQDREKTEKTIRETINKPGVFGADVPIMERERNQFSLLKMMPRGYLAKMLIGLAGDQGTGVGELDKFLADLQVRFNKQDLAQLLEKLMSQRERPKVQPGDYIQPSDIINLQLAKLKLAGMSALGMAPGQIDKKAIEGSAEQASETFVNLFTKLLPDEAGKPSAQASIKAFASTLEKQIGAGTENDATKWLRKSMTLVGTFDDDKYKEILKSITPDVVEQRKGWKETIDLSTKGVADLKTNLEAYKRLGDSMPDDPKIKLGFSRLMENMQKTQADLAQAGEIARRKLNVSMLEEDLRYTRQRGDMEVEIEKLKFGEGAARRKQIEFEYQESILKARKDFVDEWGRYEELMSLATELANERRKASYDKFFKDLNKQFGTTFHRGQETEADAFNQRMRSLFGGDEEILGRIGGYVAKNKENKKDIAKEDKGTIERAIKELEAENQRLMKTAEEGAATAGSYWATLVEIAVPDFVANGLAKIAGMFGPVLSMIGEFVAQANAMLGSMSFGFLSIPGAEGFAKSTKGWGKTLMDFAANPKAGLGGLVGGFLSEAGNASTAAKIETNNKAIKALKSSLVGLDKVEKGGGGGGGGKEALKVDKERNKLLREMMEAEGKHMSAKLLQIKQEKEERIKAYQVQYKGNAELMKLAEQVELKKMAREIQNIRNELNKGLADNEYVSMSLRQTAFHGYTDDEYKQKEADIQELMNQGFLEQKQGQEYLRALKLDTYMKELDFIQKIRSELGQSAQEMIDIYTKAGENPLITGDFTSRIEGLSRLTFLDQFTKSVVAIEQFKAKLANVNDELLTSVGLTKERLENNIKDAETIAYQNALYEMQKQSMTGFQKAVAELPTDKQIIENAQKDIVSTLSSGLSDAIVAAFDMDKNTSFRDVIKKMGDQLRRTIIKALADTLVNSLLRGIFGGGEKKETGIAGPKDLIGKLLGGIGKFGGEKEGTEKLAAKGEEVTSALSKTATGLTSLGTAEMAAMSATQSSNIALMGLATSAQSAAIALNAMASAAYSSAGASGGGGFLDALTGGAGGFGSMGEAASAAGGFGTTLGTWGTPVGGLIPNIFDLAPSRSIRRFGYGGIVSRPTLAVVGENGPEEIRPIARGSRESANQESSPTLNIVNVVDPAMVDKAIMNNPDTVVNVIAADIARGGTTSQAIKFRRR